MTTTWPAIRTAIAGAMRSLTPTSRSADGMRLYREPAPVRDWAEANPQACFRVYDVRDLHEYEPPEVSNTDVEWRAGQFEVVVCYPRQMGAFDQGSHGNLRDVDDWMHEDELAIHKALRHASGIYPSAATVQNPTVDVDERDAVIFLTFTFPFGYYRSAS